MEEPPPRREIFEIAEPIGLFATLYYVLAIVRACEPRGVTPWIEATSPLYADPKRGPDWFAYFFDRREGIRPPLAPCPRYVIGSRRTLNRILRGAPDLDIQNEFEDICEALPTFDKHLRVKPELTDLADAFAREHFAGKTVGIHWRGTDKTNDEAEPIAFQTLREAVERHATDCDTVFVATDEPAFAAFVRRTFPDKRVITWSRPTGGRFQDDLEDNLRKGRDAILDCLLLARCSLLIKTPSVLSAWSKVFAPDLPVVLVGRPCKEHHRRRLRVLGVKLRFQRWFARPLRWLGFYPESALYDPAPQAMERNRVLEIVAESEGPPRKRYH